MMVIVRVSSISWNSCFFSSLMRNTPMRRKDAITFYWSQNKPVAISDLKNYHAFFGRAKIEVVPRVRIDYAIIIMSILLSRWERLS